MTNKNTQPDPFSHSHADTTDWTLLLLLTATWGSAFMLTKMAVELLAPEMVAAGRLLIASLILLPIAALMARRPVSTPRLWLFHLGIAIFGYALPFVLVSWGQGFIDSGLAGILMAAMPLATLGLCHFLIPGERMTAYRLGGFLLGFSGVAVLIGTSAWSGFTADGTQLMGMLAVLGGAMSYAVSSILARLRPASDALFTAATTTTMASLIMVPLVWSGMDQARFVMPPLTSLWPVLALGVFSTALAAILYFRLVKRAGPAFVSQLNYLIPLWAVGCGILFLDERMELRQLYALGLILSGILVTHLGARRTCPRNAPRPNLPYSYANKTPKRRCF